MTTRKQRDKFLTQNIDRLTAQGRAENGEKWEAAADAQSDGGAALRAAADRGIAEQLSQGEQLVLDTIDAVKTPQTIASLADRVLNERMSLKGISDAVLKLEQLGLVTLTKLKRNGFDKFDRHAQVLLPTDLGTRVAALVQDITTFVAIAPFAWGQSTKSQDEAVKNAKREVPGVYVRKPYTITVYAVKRFQYVDGMGSICYRGEQKPVEIKRIENVRPPRS